MKLSKSFVVRILRGGKNDLTVVISSLRSKNCGTCAIAEGIVSKKYYCP